VAVSVVMGIPVSYVIAYVIAAAQSIRFAKL